MANDFQVKTVVSITAQQLSNQLITAFEGGIGYWCCIINNIYLDKNQAINEAKALGIDIVPAYGVLPIIETGGLLLCDAEEVTDPSEYWLLDCAAIQRGLNVMADKDPDRLREIIDETGDAETADCFIQYCLFGELVYG